MIYAVAFGALRSAVLLANAFKVLRPMPAVAPAKTNVRPLWAVVAKTCGDERRALDALIWAAETMMATGLKLGL